MSKTAAGAALGALVALTASRQAEAAPDFRLTTGVDYTSGGYGQARSTDIVVIPLSVKLYAGKWTFRASTSYLDVRGPADIGTVDEDGVSDGVIGAPGRHKGARRGFGDSYLAAKYSFDRLGGGPAYIDVQGKFRIPTGDHDNGLGVGATDFSTDAELGADWKTKGVYVDIGRRFLGDSSTLVRQDGWAYSTGAWAAFDGKTELGVWYFTRDPSLPGLERPREVGAYISRRLKDGWRAEVSLSQGLSPASPDVSAGLTISYRPNLGRRRR